MMKEKHKFLNIMKPNEMINNISRYIHNTGIKTLSLRHADLDFNFFLTNTIFTKYFKFHCTI